MRLCFKVCAFVNSCVCVPESLCVVGLGKDLEPLTLTGALAAGDTGRLCLGLFLWAGDTHAHSVKHTNMCTHTLCQTHMHGALVSWINENDGSAVTKVTSTAVWGVSLLCGGVSLLSGGGYHCCLEDYPCCPGGYPCWQGGGVIKIGRASCRARV